MKYALLAPAVLFSLLFLVWPVAEVARYAMLETNFITTRFVGLRNYAKALTDPVFLRAWLNSLAYMAFMVVGQTSIAVAVVLSTFALSKRWHDAVRIVFYVPTLSAGIIIAQSWRWIFHTQGPINWALGLVGAAPVAWFAQASSAIPAISLIVSVSGMGGMTIVLLAAVMSIDTSIFDAADIDGASGWQVRTRIVLPAIQPTIAICTLLAMIGALQVFETIYALAPYEYTATVTFHIYREAFQFGRYGLASAQAVILLIVTVLLTAMKRRVER